MDKQQFLIPLLTLAVGAVLGMVLQRKAKAEAAKGGRKVEQDRFNGLLMLAGTGVILLACIVEPQLIQIAVSMGGLMLTAVGFKGWSFNKSNEKEHAPGEGK